MSCWKVVPRPKHERVLSTKIALKKTQQKRDNTEVQSLLEVRSNGEADGTLENVSSRAYFAIMRLVLCIKLKRGMEDASHGLPERIYAWAEKQANAREIAQIYIPRERKRKLSYVIAGKSIRSTWHCRYLEQFIYNIFDKGGMKPLKSTPCVCHAK